MKDLYINRLLNLAEHLEFGNLGHDKFNLSVFSTKSKYVLCETAGCALGECPTAFPDDWKWSESYHPTYKGKSPFDSAILFFNISVGATLHLFATDTQYPLLYGGKVLEKNATKEDVANNIREFVETKRYPVRSFFRNLINSFKKT